MFCRSLNVLAISKTARFFSENESLGSASFTSLNPIYEFLLNDFEIDKFLLMNYTFIHCGVTKGILCPFRLCSTIHNDANSLLLNSYLLLIS